MKRDDIMCLGPLADAIRKCDRAKPVVFDFDGVSPDGMHSFRGYYEQLALGYSEGTTSAGAFSAACDGAIGTTFEGYKGGNYRMWFDTPVWVSNYGRAEMRGVVGVEELEGEVVIKTGMVGS